jgi:ABC-type transport system involved in multi-copper enzyme maturation permease subunit
MKSSAALPLLRLTARQTALRIRAVTFLPIVDRELRVTAHQPRTWWRRVLIMAVAVATLVFTYWAVGGRSATSTLGRQLFVALSVLGMIYGLLAGPLATVDCLARERREGTLGLLFLTELRSYDVVLGKVAASSFDIILGIVAAAPVIAIPVLLGGVSLGQLAQVGLAMANFMFLSLAAGVCASALVASGRAAFGITFGFLLFLTIGFPWVLEGLLKLHVSTRASTYVYMLCPAYSMALCFDNGLRMSSRHGFWVGFAAMHALGWVLLAIAIRRTGNSWQEATAEGTPNRWRERLRHWNLGSGAMRRRWRSMLDRNPVSWLEGRDLAQPRMLWAVFLVLTAGWVLTYDANPSSWTSGQLEIVWPVIAQQMLCLWIAAQAPRRMADDKQSGALELLLCTPLEPAEIVRGQMRILGRRFGGALASLLALDLLMIAAVLSIAGTAGGGRVMRQDLIWLAACGLVVFPAQAYSMAKIGLYQGLVQSTSLRATLLLVWKVGLLPWVTWLAFILSYIAIQRHMRSLPVVTNTFVWLAWTASQLAVYGVFLAHANHRLRASFRTLAAKKFH